MELKEKIKPGYKKTKLGWIPEDWKLMSIDEITHRITNRVEVEPDKEYQEIGIRSHGKGLFHKDKVTGKSLGNKRVFWIDPGCFIVNIVFAWEQAVAKTTEKEIGMIASHRFPMYKPQKGILDLDYILYFFKTPLGKHLLGLASPGGAGRNKTLGQKEFGKLLVPIPPIGEQEKIVSVLSTWSIAIKKLTLLIEHKEENKKGLMQELLNGKVRVNGTSRSWTTNILGEILKFGSGRDYKHLGRGNIPVYGTGGIMTYVNDYLYEGESVGIGRKGTIDKPVFLKGKFWTVDTLFYTHSFKGTIPKYTYYLFQSINWKKYNEASGVPSLSKTTIRKIPISLPTIEEQKSISEILFKCDQEIRLLKNKHKSFRLQMKGMKQILLTGKRRVSF